MNSIMHALLSLFQHPADTALEPGDRVNLAPAGAVTKTDGYVVAVSPNQGVLVEWPQGGSDWFSARELALISD